MIEFPQREIKTNSKTKIKSSGWGRPLYTGLSKSCPRPLLEMREKGRTRFLFSPLTPVKRVGQYLHGEFPDVSEVVRRSRGPFGFAQGRLFDFAETSIREVSAPLRRTAMRVRLFLASSFPQSKIKTKIRGNGKGSGRRRPLHMYGDVGAGLAGKSETVSNLRSPSS